MKTASMESGSPSSAEVVEARTSHCGEMLQCAAVIAHIGESRTPVHRRIVGSAGEESTSGDPGRVFSLPLMIRGVMACESVGRTSGHRGIAD